MDHSDEPVSTISTRVKNLRARKRWTGAELGERMTRLGVPWDRSIVANLENGRRKSVSVSELLALSVALDTAPIHLLIPTTEGRYRITPELEQSTARARAWVRGDAPLPGTDTRIFRTEVPEDEFPDADLPESAVLENEVSRHLVAGMEAALETDLTPDDLADYVRRSFTMMRTLHRMKGGGDGE